MLFQRVKMYFSRHIEYAMTYDVAFGTVVMMVYTDKPDFSQAFHNTFGARLQDGTMSYLNHKGVFIIAFDADAE